ncbi:uncharacterized protein LY89DRAFT_670908 [Mollisia scopiformis]|uniref:Uncharacterized protein n=1 Tax=Mollisia scopiformis TaxID=149040 RepID=A0A194X5I7_MOLSC|nr:uncharacterized protein LY89DRAFT_670908 [Mollisia scopiformis]KUJ15436.1 hypothetical protein LY89DRAFT_670908 [Mollisia scopiformis]
MDSCQSSSRSSSSTSYIHRPHVDLPLLKEDFELGLLRYDSYSPSSISEAVVHCVNRIRLLDENKWHPRQRYALKSFKNEGTWKLGMPNNLEDLRKWFEIFNDAFFGGFLTGLVVLRFENITTMLSDHELAMGLTSSPQLSDNADLTYRLERPEITITLTSRPHAHPTKDVRIILENLLHELCHAIVMAYSCCCRSCQRHQMYGGGNDGPHGICWQRLAQAIEKAVDVSVGCFKLGLNLSRSSSLASDVFEHWRFPSEAEIRPLELDTLEILERIQELRDWTIKGAAWVEENICGPESENEMELRLPITHDMGFLDECHFPARKFREDLEIGCLKPLSYSAEDISAGIISYLTPTTYYCLVGDLAPHQQQALKLFKNVGAWSISNPHNLNDLKKYFEIFDGAYFNGALEGYCNLEFVSSERLIERGQNSCGILSACGGFVQPGAERDPRYPVENPQVTISISRLQQTTTFSIIQMYLNTLLHQMLHAIFDIYQYPSVQGSRQSMGQDHNTRHHSSWAATAYALERCNRPGRNLFGLGLWLWTTIGLAMDAQHGSSVPNEVELRSIDTDMVTLLERLKHIRTEEAERRKHARTFMKPIKASSCCLRDQCSTDGWDRNFGYDRSIWTERLGD